MDHPQGPARDIWIDTGRGRMFARSWRPPDRGDDPGGKPPIVLFHDSLGCVGLWRTFPAVLAAASGREVIAYDRLGFGRSDPRKDKLGPDFIREEAETCFPGLREQLGFDHCIVFGHSVGGGMAAHCAAIHASICDALITESAQAFVEDRTRAGILEAETLFKEREAFERLRRHHGGKARWVLDAWIGTWLSPEFEGWTLDGALSKVECPTLVLHGREDEYGSVRHPETIARSVRGPSEIEIMPDTRHVPHREHEHWVANRVARFIGEARP
jgi:pimeloyl-ACP methyl ester carboxylesterase